MGSGPPKLDPPHPSWDPALIPLGNLGNSGTAVAIKGIFSWISLLFWDQENCLRTEVGEAGKFSILGLGDTKIVPSWDCGTLLSHPGIRVRKIVTSWCRVAQKLSHPGIGGQEMGPGGAAEPGAVPTAGPDTEITGGDRTGMGRQKWAGVAEGRTWGHQDRRTQEPTQYSYRKAISKLCKYNLFQ